MELCQKPFVYVGHLPDFVNTISTVERSRNRKNTLVGRVDELLINILHEVIL